MGTLCKLLNRRSFLHGLLLSFGLCSCRTGATPTEEGFAPLREPVVIALDATGKSGGAYPFEAWLSPEVGSDKILDGILLNNGEDLAAYSLYCPHEACLVKLEPDPGKLSSVVPSGTALPGHPVLYCACHFSVFDTRASGRHISGPAERGLYRFLFEKTGGAVHVTHVEASILDVYAWASSQDATTKEDEI
jgi:Rieske Fe-S protein